MGDIATGTGARTDDEDLSSLSSVDGRSKLLSILINSLFVVTIASFGWVLTTNASLGRYVRYMADDWCTVADVRVHGIIGTVVHEYNTWSARSSYIFTMALVQSFGPLASRLLPALLIVGIVSALTFLFRELYYAVYATPKRLILIPAAGATAIVYLQISAPRGDVYGQLLLWDGGSLNYLLPFIPLLFYWGYFVRRLNEGSKPGIGYLIGV